MNDKISQEDLILLERTFRECINKSNKLDLVSSKYLLSCYNGVDEIRKLIIKQEQIMKKPKKITEYLVDSSIGANNNIKLNNNKNKNVTNTKNNTTNGKKDEEDEYYNLFINQVKKTILPIKRILQKKIPIFRHTLKAHIKCCWDPI